MTDIITADDLKAVYKHAQERADAGKIRMSVLMEPPFSYSKDKARNVLMKLVQNRLAFLPIDGQSDPSDIKVVVREQELAAKLKVVTNPEVYAVFQIIELSQDMGTGPRDILRAINDKLRKASRPPIQAPNVARAIKTLEAEKLIKPIKSVRDNGRKIYILFNLDGDRAIVGGVFYKDGNFNTEMVEDYRNKILTYLQAQNVQISRQQLLQYIYSSGDASGGVRLSEPDLDKVIRTLVLDNLIIHLTHPHTGDASYVNAKWPSFEDLERLPCASCPLQQVCQIEEVDHFDSIALRRQNLKTRDAKKVASLGTMQPENYVSQLSSKVTPATCPYFNQWLKMPFLPWVSPEEGGGSGRDGEKSAAIENDIS